MSVGRITDGTTVSVPSVPFNQGSVGVLIREFVIAMSEATPGLATQSVAADGHALGREHGRDVDPDVDVSVPTYGFTCDLQLHLTR